MKPYFYSILTVSILLFVLSCDKIEAPYKNTGDFGGGTEVTTRKVLLEDYTGHRCVNCPDAAKLAGELKALYGERLIIIGVHAGFFAAPAAPPFELDMRSEVGNAWNNHFNIQAYPSGLINRTSPSGQYALSFGHWSTRVTEIIDDPTVADLSISTNYNEATRRLDIGIQSTFKTDVGGSPKLQVVITENNIVAAQLNSNPNIGETPIINDFVHKHVLRAAVNGSWGENILGTGNSLTVGNTYQHNYSITINPAWDESNISVVAFIYNESNFEIYQVEEKHVK
jgi:hypothetical protein